MDLKTPEGRLAYVDQLIASMKDMMRPKTVEPWDSKRKDRLQSIKTQIMLSGGTVKES